MSPRKSDSRQRMVRSTVKLLREYGANATSIDRVLAHSGAPRGSVYHHFPAGRTQLIEEAIALAGSTMAGVIESAMQAEDPVEAIDAFFTHWRNRLAENAFRTGCPIVAVAVETNDEAPQLAHAAGDVFAGWQGAFQALFRRHGLAEDRCRSLAALIVAAEEGAVVMCRAQQSSAPMEAVAKEVHSLLVHALKPEPAKDQPRNEDTAK
jgi:AcrR family transcriptional regulator